MREHPILFSGPMVRAILAGQKTQTRRAVKSPYISSDWSVRPAIAPRFYGHTHDWYLPAGAQPVAALKCPYGQPGDRLWVRETWGVVSQTFNSDGDMIDWIPDRPATAINEMPFGNGYYSGHVIYAADGPYGWAGDDDGGGEPRSTWKPSIHMPRAVSRILLEIISVRVERLKDISEADAQDEGADALNFDNCGPAERKLFDMPLMEKGTPYRNGFALVWEGINGDGSWAANPWVWVVKFRRLSGADLSPDSVDNSMENPMTDQREQPSTRVRGASHKERP